MCSSVGLEHYLDRVGVGGSNPSTLTQMAHDKFYRGLFCDLLNLTAVRQFVEKTTVTSFQPLLIDDPFKKSIIKLFLCKKP